MMQPIIKTASYLLIPVLILASTGHTQDATDRKRIEELFPVTADERDTDLYDIIKTGQPSARQKEVNLAKGEKMVGDVVAGVDYLGRVLIAMDKQPTDGLVDISWLFTANERLAGPWSKYISHAHVDHRLGSLKITAQDGTFALAIATRSYSPPEIKQDKYLEVFENFAGQEFTRAEPLFAEPQATLASMDHHDLATWPEAFWYDLLAPESLHANCHNQQEGCLNFMLETPTVSND